MPALENRYLGWSVAKPLTPQPTEADRLTRDRFLSSAVTDEDRYDLLFKYFLRGFLDHASVGHARIYYPGMASAQGHAVNGLEGFARTAPLLGAWVHAGRNPRIFVPGTARAVDLVQLLRSGLLAGTDPKSPEYWGEIQTGDQRIVEAADIGRLLWLTRTQIWDRLRPEERKQIAAWLYQVNKAYPGRQNNWLLFPVVANAFLKSVGERYVDRQADYRKFVANYLEQGWFRDGPRGQVDYYNSWGISYDLFWIDLMDPTFDPQLIRPRLVQSGRLTAHLISPVGIPMMGRSVCYRTAVPTAVLTGSFIAPDAIPPGLARRALDSTWRHFISRDILRQGSMTMGYFETDPRLIDRYSGGGSCHWGLRSLTLAYMAGPGHPFWRDRQQALPVEVRDFALTLSKLGWQVRGKRSDGNIVIVIPENARGKTEVQPFTAWMGLIERVTHRPRRPDNKQIKYGLPEYSAIEPFGGALND